MKILVVDDNAENRYLMEVLLKARGFEAILAENGVDALARLREGAADLILSDILMPKMDGYTFCRECRQDEKLRTIPFIFITAAYTDEKDERFALGLGADRYIRRPVEPEDLVKIIEQALKSHGEEKAPEAAEREYLAEYSERLVAQLERKVSELEVEISKRKRLERDLRTITACNQAMVHAADESSLLLETCRSIVEIGGYRLAWAGFISQVVAQYGSADWHPQPSMEPAATAIRTKKPALFRDPLSTELADEALRLGYSSCIALPFSNESGVFGTLSIYASEPDAFDAESRGLLAELAEDLSFGVTALRTRAQRDRALKELQGFAERIRRNLDDTIDAFAAVVEMRDPYTAGHERRVAELAAAIGREMGLQPEQVEGLRVAGGIHDVGKIKVPAEILTKPGELNELEFGLIRMHTQAGFEILHGIDFPWPIAATVSQHHERLDGSGYPQGLKDGEIVLEAQILAVADVVESMISHRPYRPALGIEAALDDIVENRGKLYNPQAVDACLKLFRSGGFKFPS